MRDPDCPQRGEPAMYWLVTVGSNVLTLGVRSPLSLGDEEGCDGFFAFPSLPGAARYRHLRGSFALRQDVI
jgi:hypothetical protein